MYVWSHIYRKSTDQLGKVANPARGQLNYVRMYVYRKYRSLGTPPRPTFQARLLRSQEDVNTDRYVVKVV